MSAGAFTRCNCKCYSQPLRHARTSQTIVLPRSWRRSVNIGATSSRSTFSKTIRNAVVGKGETDNNVVEAEWTDVVIEPPSNPSNPSPIPDGQFPGGGYAPPEPSQQQQVGTEEEGSPSDVQMEVYTPDMEKDEKEGTADQFDEDSDAEQDDSDDDDFPGMELTPEEKALYTENYNRNCKILLELMEAGPRLEDKIKQYRDDITEPLLVMLVHRMAMEIDLDDEGDPEMIQLMEYLFRRLRAELERDAASPAMRLLDDALQVMNDSSSKRNLQDRRTLVRNLLADAFTGQKQESIDIFAVAMQLAAGEEVEPEGMELVSRQKFIQETEEFLQEAAQRQQQLKKKLKRERDPEEAKELKSTIEHREQVLSSVEEVLTIARGFVQ